MKSKIKQPIYIRLIIMGVIAFLGMLTIMACGQTMVWVKPGSTQQELNIDNYQCTKESQKTVSDYSARDVVVDQKLYKACMEARGWSLKE